MAESRAVILCAAPIVKGFEDLSLTAYVCPAGKLTIGYGHVIKPGEDYLKAGISEEKALELLESDLAWAEREVKAARSDLQVHQAAALVSLVYNIGAGAWRGSEIRAKVAALDLYAVARQFQRWKFSGGVELAGLVRRRKSERIMFEGVKPWKYWNG